MAEQQPARHRNAGRLLAHIAVVIGILAIAAAAFVLSYRAARDIALAAGVPAVLARLYPTGRRNGGQKPRRSRRGRPARPCASNGSAARPRHPMTDRHPARDPKSAGELPAEPGAGPYSVRGWPGRRFRTRTPGPLTARSR